MSIAEVAQPARRTRPMPKTGLCERIFRPSFWGLVANAGDRLLEPNQGVPDEIGLRRKRHRPVRTARALDRMGEMAQPISRIAGFAAIRPSREQQRSEA